MTDAIRSAAVQAREALQQLADVIDAAGLGNLSRGVQLGPTVWYVKASDAMDFARKNIATLDSALAAAPAPQPNMQQLAAGALYPQVSGFAPAPQHDGQSAFRDAVLEEAAKKAESDEFYGTVIPVAIAAAIRGMKGQP